MFLINELIVFVRFFIVCIFLDTGSVYEGSRILTKWFERFVISEVSILSRLSNA